MYRVMIVDDEEPVLESFSFMLERGIPGFELAGVARSGPEAIAKAPELRPDLVFMDIQMQGMDGMEAIVRIQERHPDIVFIISSAYERFDIAQKAIPLGVFNYLVKPVSRKALEEEFAKVKAQLDQMREQSDQRMKEAQLTERMREEEKNRFLLGLSWASPGEREWREFARLFSIKADSCAVMLLKIANPLPEEELEKAYGSTVRFLQYKTECLSAVLSGQAILLFPDPGPPERIERLVEKASEEAGPLEYRFGLGKPVHFSRLNESYREAFEQLRGLEGKGGAAGSGRRGSRELCEKFLVADWEEVKRLFERHWMEVFVSNGFLVAKAKMVAFFVQLLDLLDRDLRIDCAIDIDPAEEIIGLSSVEKWRQWASYMMDRLRSIIKENKDQYLPKPLALAVNHVKENYAKPLQLSAVAERCEISQGYLSRLFSEYLNTTFIDYLNTLRINEAVRLLRNERKSVKEVAYLVGYSDPNYFSRIFRRYMNVSPSDMAKGGGNNDE